MCQSTASLRSGEAVFGRRVLGHLEFRFQDLAAAAFSGLPLEV